MSAGTVCAKRSRTGMAAQAALSLSRPNLSYPKMVLGPKRAARFRPTDQSRLA